MTSPTSLDPRQSQASPAQSAAHVFTLAIGWLSMIAGLALPVVAMLLPDSPGLRYAPVSLGLLPAGLFLATRTHPRRASSAVVAAIVLPLGAGALAHGSLSLVNFDGQRAGPAPLAIGVLLLVIGGAQAWVTWANPDKRRAQVAAQAMGVAIWIIFAVASLQTIAADDEVDYIEPVAMALHDAELRIEVPHQGGCADSQLVVETKLRRSNVLEVIVFDEDGFRCLAACLSDRRAVCTETVVRHLSPPPPPDVTLVAVRPATGLQRVPLAFLALGILLGGGLWAVGGLVRPQEAEPADA